MTRKKKGNTAIERKGKINLDNAVKIYKTAKYIFWTVPGYLDLHWHIIAKSWIFEHLRAWFHWGAS